MNEYPVGSICEIIDNLGSAIFHNVVGEIVTITGGLRPHTNPLFGELVYEVNGGNFVASYGGYEYTFTPPHRCLRLITPPTEGKGLELILRMFPKVEETA